MGKPCCATVQENKSEKVHSNFENFIEKMGLVSQRLFERKKRKTMFFFFVRCLDYLLQMLGKVQAVQARKAVYTQNSNLKLFKIYTADFILICF